MLAVSPGSAGCWLMLQSEYCITWQNLRVGHAMCNTKDL